MSFLAPLFLLGVAAVVWPILFHLIRRTSRERITFSSLMFLSPTPPRVTRRSRLENIFLLILRCLVLGLLALGFARPFFRKPVVASPETKTTQQIILLLDTSASMRRQNLWPTARAKAEEVLGKVSPADRVAVFAFDRQIHSLVSFEQWSAMAAGERVSLTLQRLGELQPGWAGTYLGQALTAAAEAFEDVAQDERSARRQIVVVTDLQEGAHLDGLQGYEWPRGVEVVVEQIKAKKTTNAGLQLLTDFDDSIQSTNELGPRVRVSNASDSKREAFKVRWESAIEGAPIEVYVPPGQSRTVSMPPLPAADSSGKLILLGDDDEFDNTAFSAQAKAEEVRVLYLGNESETDHAHPLFYLKRAFQQTRRQAVQLFSRRADAALSTNETASAHLMIVADPLPEPALRAAQEFLAARKTILVVMKNISIAQTIAQLSGASAVGAEEIAGDRYTMFGEIKFDHPLFAPFADPRFSDFTKIHFWKHRRIGIEQIPGARILARLDNGNPALVEASVRNGSLLVLCSGWQPADSQLALSSKFVPLLYSLLELSGSLTPQRSQFSVGDEISLATTNSAPSVAVRKPDGTQVELMAGSHFNQTDQPGVYAIASRQPPVQVAVNLDPAESKTAPLPTEELERLGLPLKKEIPKQSTKETEKKRQHLLATELENQQRLWRWFLLTAFAVVILETWIAALLTRRASTQIEPTKGRASHW